MADQICTRNKTKCDSIKHQSKVNRKAMFKHPEWTSCILMVLKTHRILVNTQNKVSRSKKHHSGRLWLGLRLEGEWAQRPSLKDTPAAELKR